MREVDERAAPGQPCAPTAPAPWAVYLLTCEGGRSYIGISPRPMERYESHRAGRGGAYTRANRPRALAAVVWFDHRSAAASMEVRLKALTRRAKLEWFKGFPATTPSSPATLDDAIAALPPRRAMPFRP